MTVVITLTTVGADTGPFNLFSDVNGYTIAFALGVTKEELEAGYPSDLVPDGTTTIRVQSVNSLCNNYIDLPTGITTTTTTTPTPIQEFCVNWTAENNLNIKMSTQGYIDFTEVLAGRTIQPGPLSVGTITGYRIAGMPEFTCSIDMDFTSTRATWDTDLLPAETDKVLTTLIYSLELIFSDNSDYFIPNINYAGETNAVVIPGQLTSSYNNCPL